MAISSPINVGNISRGVNSLKIGLGRVKSSVQGIKSILFTKTKVKQQAISGKKILQKRRQENILRKDQEDLLEASGITPTIRSTRNVIVDSTKGFLGRILEFVGTLFVGWLLYNLPTIIAMTKDLIIRIQTLVGALTGFIGNIFNVFGDIGHILTGVLSDIVHLDFLDTDRKVRSSFDDLNTHFDNMGKQFEDGVNVFKTSLGGGAGEEPIPSTGTVQSGPTAIIGSEQEKVEKVLGSYEGSRLKAYKDAKGIWTIGEGNTSINGRAVRQGDTITAEQSIQMKRSAIEEHRQRAINQVGLQKWNSLSENSRVALTSLVYNYGSIPRSVLPAVKSGDSGKIASAIEGLSGDDGGINAWRRKDEAQIIRTGSSSRVKLPQAQFGQPQYSTTGGALTKTKKGPYNRNFYGYAPSNGQVQYLTGDISQKDNYESSHGTTSNYHDHLGFIDHATALKAFDFFKSKGFDVTEMKDRTSLGPSHQKPGDPHAKGLAFDVPGAQWRGSGAIGSKEYQGSAKVRAALAQFLGSPESQVSSPGSTTNVGALTPERRGPTVVVANNPQPQQPPSGGGGGGGGGAVLSIPSSDGLNSFIKQNLLLDLAYT